MATAVEPIPNGTLQLESYTVFDANPTDESESAEKRWPGWPGHCVFRLIVPVLKVGIIIGRKGELIKKTCDETHARIRVLDAPVGTPDRIVSFLSFHCNLSRVSFVFVKFHFKFSFIHNISFAQIFGFILFFYVIAGFVI